MNICRLCLSVSTQKTYKISEENDVLRKIHLCLFLHISLDENLPSSICSDCLNKVEEINYFKTKVTENQNILNQHLNNGINALEIFYSNLKKGSKVKEEIKEVEVPVVEHLNITVEKKTNESQAIIKQEQTDVKEKFTFEDDGEEIKSSIQAEKKRNTVKINLRPMRRTNLKLKKHFGSAIHATNSVLDIHTTVVKENIDTTTDTTDTATDTIVVKEAIDTTTDATIIQAKRKIKLVKIKKKRPARKTNLKLKKDFGSAIRGTDSVSAKKNIHTAIDTTDTTVDTTDTTVDTTDTTVDTTDTTVDTTAVKENIDSPDSSTDCTPTKDSPDTNKKSDLKFKCLTCFIILDSRKDLAHHYVKEHGKNVEIDESLMNCFSVTKKEGVMHYKCGKCDKLFIKRRGMNKHLMTHDDRRPYVCNICGKNFKSAENMIVHGLSHEGVRLKCSYECGYSTVYGTMLKDHERTHTDGKKFKYKCEKCGKGFQIRSHFREHDNVHKGIKPFVCATCGKAFDCSRYLQSHRLYAHIKAAELERFVCEHCSLQLSSKRTLLTHLFTEHGIGQKYLCDSCGKSLTSLESYKSHMRRHLGEKPFSCSTCGKSFTSKNNLRVHERTHTGERRHACKLCGNRYTQRGPLLKHMRQHEGWQESLECSKCRTMFEYRSQVVSHEKVCKSSEG